MQKPKPQLTLFRPSTYQIQVMGLLEEGWSDWVGEMTLTVERNPEGSPVSTLTGSLDQAALQGLLRRLYSSGLPLISVVWIKV